jgi:hypothetical protein
MAGKARGATIPKARAVTGSATRPARSAPVRVQTQAASFSRLVNGFEARLREIDEAMTVTLKKLAAG